MAPAAPAGLAAAVLAVALLAASAAAAVTYDRKAVVVNGQRRILLSGSIHYPRSTPEVPPGSRAQMQLAPAAGGAPLCSPEALSNRIIERRCGPG